MARNKNQVLYVLLAVALTAGFIWWYRQKYASQSSSGGDSSSTEQSIDLVAPSDDEAHQTNLHDLELETELSGYGMGPGLVDDRRPHVIA